MYISRQLLPCIAILLATNTCVGEDRAKISKIASKAVSQCPKIIANGEQGSFYERSSSVKFPYLCFSNRKDARTLGLVTAAKIDKDFTGWWRVNGRQKKNSCETELSTGKYTTFLQVLGNQSGVFAELCGPGQFSSGGTQRYVGTTNDGGFVVSTNSITADAGTTKLGCSDGQKEVTQSLDIRNIVNGRSNFARFTQIERCLTDVSGEKTCSRQWTGEASHETSHSFPPVPANVNQFTTGCSIAVTRCGDCHSEFIR